MEGRVNIFGHAWQYLLLERALLILENVSITEFRVAAAISFPTAGARKIGSSEARTFSAAAENEILNAIGRVATRSLLDNGAPGVHCSQLYERIVFQTVFAKAVSDRLHHPQLKGARRPGGEQDRF